MIVLSKIVEFVPRLQKGFGEFLFIDQDADFWICVVVGSEGLADMIGSHGAVIFDTFFVVAGVDQDPWAGHHLLVKIQFFFKFLGLAQQFLNGVIFGGELHVELVDGLEVVEWEVLLLVKPFSVSF